MIIDSIDDLPQVSFPDVTSDHVLTGRALLQLVELRKALNDYNIDMVEPLKELHRWSDETEGNDKWAKELVYKLTKIEEALKINTVKERTEAIKYWLKY